jgi:hypothetical protein
MTQVIEKAPLCPRPPTSPFSHTYTHTHTHTHHTHTHAHTHTHHPKFIFHCLFLFNCCLLRSVYSVYSHTHTHTHTSHTHTHTHTHVTFSKFVVFHSLFLFNCYLLPVVGFGFWFWLLLYAHRHWSILRAAGHIILTPANQLMAMGLKIWSLSNPGSNQQPSDHWLTSLPTALPG